jgi:hypothetical protein
MRHPAASKRLWTGSCPIRAPPSNPESFARNPLQRFRGNCHRFRFERQRFFKNRQRFQRFRIAKYGCHPEPRNTRKTRKKKSDGSQGLKMPFVFFVYFVVLHLCWCPRPGWRCLFCHTSQARSVDTEPKDPATRAKDSSKIPRQSSKIPKISRLQNTDAISMRLRLLSNRWRRFSQIEKRNL